MQKIYSVIHAEDDIQVYRNIERSIEAGADGTFLINHAGIPLERLLESLAEAKTKYNTRTQRFYFGINTLGVDELQAFKLANDYGADGLWLDESYVREGNELDEQLAKMDEARKLFHGEYFGSVAFKTQGPCPNPAAVAVKAIDHVDVITTSGPGTAKAPEVEKIASMRAAIGAKPLAIASGMTPDNIHLFPMVDAILVASGVQDSWTELNTDKLRLMVQRKGDRDTWNEINNERLRQNGEGNK